MFNFVNYLGGDMPEKYATREIKITRLHGEKFRMVKCFRVGCNQWASAEIETKLDGTTRIKREYRCGPCLRVWETLNNIEHEFD